MRGGGGGARSEGYAAPIVRTVTVQKPEPKPFKVCCWVGEGEGREGGGGGSSIRRICITDSEQSLYRNLSLNPSRCVVGWERVRGRGGGGARSEGYAAPIVRTVTVQKPEPKPFKVCCWVGEGEGREGGGGAARSEGYASPIVNSHCTET